jgi:serine/threonine-protein kinase
VAAKTILHYRILGRLGTGGMGEVFLAEDDRLGRKVALKMLPDELAAQPLHLERFRREARAAAALQHPNIVTIYAVEEVSGTPFLTMELVEGQTLSEVIPPSGLELDRLLSIAVQVAQALAAAHARGILHRDIKPKNLMVDSEGRVKVLDFGIAKIFLTENDETQVAGLNTGLTGEGQILGTVAYMSPEQLRNQPLDPRSDIFSFGVVLYEMATGRQPFVASTPVDQIVAILERRLPLPTTLRAGLPQRLDEIVTRCLEREPWRRYQSAWELRDQLEALRLEILSGSHRAASSQQMLAASSQPLQALAALPFENLSGEEEYFVLGMTDALISSLSRIDRVRVISRQSVMRYRGSDKPLPEIARELGVDLVMTGSLLRAGNRVRITTQLVRAEPEEQIWAEIYHRDLEDILALQDEVAREVAREVQLELAEPEEAPPTNERRVDPAVYELYLQGRFHWDKRTPEGLRKAVEYFNQAIAAAPGYAAAYAGLADAHALLAYFRHEPAKEGFGKAQTAALRALSLDSSLAEAHASLGFVMLFHGWNGPEAERELRQALALNPSYATAHHWLWGYLASTGRLQESGQQIKIARQLNPFSPTIIAAAAAQARMMGDFDLAIDLCRKSIDLEPGYALTHDYLWILLHRKGRLEEAFAEYRCALALWGYREIAERAGDVYTHSGYRAALLAAAEALVEEAERRVERAPVQVIAETYALLGEIPQAVAWVRRGVERREPFVIWLRYLTELDALRGDPDFESLVQQVAREHSGGWSLP